MRLIIFILLLGISSEFYSQEVAKDWHLLDQKKDNVPGISLKKAYKLLKKSKKTSTPIIIAVLDSGLDINHEDIKAVVWRNSNEIEGNQLDDDKNGYADDIHGWNFIGGPDGKNIEAETLEVTRLYRKYKTIFKEKNKFNITPEERSDYEKFISYKKAVNEGISNLENAIKRNKEDYDFFVKLIPPLQKAMGTSHFTRDQLINKKLKGELGNLKIKFIRILDRNSDKQLTSKKLIEHYEELNTKMETLQTRLKYNYSLDFNGREIIGDNYKDLHQKNYGNNDLSKRTEHGTHVAGIIGAERNNKIGINGIADNVIIMPIRNTPMGDETDKDVANGIRYAVDNGAKIINMSFGKAFSPEKEIVDEAVKYAEEKGVLIVHAAGNSNTNIDYFYNYPSALLKNGTVATNWIEVGASSMNLNEKLVAEFSNYGKEAVDIFAPGVDIYSTMPGDKYDTNSGTSMAAPVVTGVAALIWSYFPELSLKEIKSILISSGESFNTNVNQPGSEHKIPFSSLSKSGKIVNAYNAVKLALKKYNN